MSFRDSETFIRADVTPSRSAATDFGHDYEFPAHSTHVIWRDHLPASYLSPGFYILHPAHFHFSPLSHLHTHVLLHGSFAKSFQPSFSSISTFFPQSFHRLRPTVIVTHRKRRLDMLRGSTRRGAGDYDSQLLSMVLLSTRTCRAALADNRRAT